MRKDRLLGIHRDCELSNLALGDILYFESRREISGECAVYILIGFLALIKKHRSRRDEV